MHRMLRPRAGFACFALALALSGCDLLFSISTGDPAIDANSDASGDAADAGPPSVDAAPVRGPGSWLVVDGPLTSGFLPLINPGIRELRIGDTLDAVFEAQGVMYEITLQLGQTRPLDDATGLTPFAPSENFTVGSTARFTQAGDKVYFGASATVGDLNVYTSTWSGSAWTPATDTEVSQINVDERWFSPCEDGTGIYALSDGGARRLVAYAGGTSTEIPQLQGAGEATAPRIMPNCLELYFESDRLGQADIFYSQRSSIAEPWSTPVPVVGVSTVTEQELDPWVANDGQVMIFSILDNNGNYHLRYARRLGGS